MIFDDELEDNLMYISTDFYNLLVRIGKLNSSTGIANFYNTSIDFQCKLLNWGNFTPFYSYIICNKQTYKKYIYSTILEMKTTKSTTVNLTSGRLPESSNEIVLNKNYYNEDEYGNGQFEIKEYGVTKTFDIVGYFDKQVSSLNVTNCSCLTSQEGYDFILDCDIYSLSVNYSAYVNTNELTSLDYQYLIDNDKTIFNDVTKYAYNSYNYFSGIRRTTIVSVIFIGVFDLVFIIFYLAFYNKENQENFNLLNILKKTKYIKKSFIGFKVLINIAILVLGLILFFITQNILSTKLLNELAYYFKGADYYLVSSNLFINLFINDFMIYTIPLILIIQSIVFMTQIRRVTK